VQLSEKKKKEDDYSAQAAAIFEDMKARDNVLWAGKQRISFTKRVCNCKCALRLHYVQANKEWRATVTIYNNCKLEKEIENLFS
jgi:hypothetical protein